MMLNTLLDYLADMTVLYGQACVYVYVDIDGERYRITSLEGKQGEKRPNERKDPNVITIKAKRIKDDFERG